ncbi:MAG: bifunctional 5,10-methylenetetrahydrofolate dehydrogenase/5,10-methenyltetrahydrofolate cyclohydrolase [candidate division WOR-3 bacterium]
MNNPLILNGKRVAKTIRSELAEQVSNLKSSGINPRLGIILVGNHPPSLLYVTSKEKACTEVGIDVKTFHLPESASKEQVAEIIHQLNEDRTFHAQILQLPLPSHLPSEELIGMISPFKDVDGLTPVNLGRLVAGRPLYVPATPLGIVELLVRYSIPISGRRIVIVGRGELVGKPLANLLLLHGTRGDATVTICHSKTTNLAHFTKEAEVLVVAAGRPSLITGDMVSEGVVVVDAGINRSEHGVVGDVDFNSVASKAQAITPVPGGVGPMTVAMLLKNTVLATKKNASLL